MPGTNWYRRRWNESRGDRHDRWGHSTWHFETTSTGQVERQVEIYDNGTVKRYHHAHPADNDGVLSEADLPAEQWRPYAITQALFEAVWRTDEHRDTEVELLQFVEVTGPDQGPVRTWLLDVPADATPEPLWPGLWELKYPEGGSNPFLDACRYRNPTNQRLPTRCATTRRIHGCLSPDQLR